MKSQITTQSAVKARRRKENLVGYLFIAPWLVCFLAFTALPFLA